MIVVLSPVVLGSGPGRVDWSNLTQANGADFVRLANWSSSALKVSLAGADYFIDPWTADVLPAYCKPSLTYEPVTVTGAAGLPPGATATLLVEVAYGEVIPGVYPLPLRQASADTVIDLQRDFGVPQGVDATAQIQAAYNAIPAGGGVVEWSRNVTPGTTYIISAPITPKPGTWTRGQGKWNTAVKRADSTNAKMFACEGVTGLKFSDLTLDQNGANQASNQEGIRGDRLSDNLTVQDCQFRNSGGFAVLIFAGPLFRALNTRLLFNHVYALAGNSDLLVPVSAGGLTSGNYVEGYTAALINIYESDDHPCIGNTVRVLGGGGSGIRLSSSNGSPIASNSVICGAGDIAYDVIKETDNGGARAQVEATLTANSGRGTATSTFLRIQNASGIRLQGGGTVDTFGKFIDFSVGPIADVWVEVPTLIAVTTLLTFGVTPTDYAVVDKITAGTLKITGALTVTGLVTPQLGVGNDTPGHIHSHNHSAHHHSHTHSITNQPSGTTGAASAGTPHTHQYNDPDLATYSTDATDTTPGTDSTGESAVHTHKG